MERTYNKTCGDLIWVRPDGTAQIVLHNVQYGVLQSKKAILKNDPCYKGGILKITYPHV